MSVQDMRDFETLARNELSAAAYGYYAGGSFDEQTLADSGVLPLRNQAFSSSCRHLSTGRRYPARIQR